MKRLLCIISCMNTGGAETFLMKLYRALDKTQYQMDFCVNTEENYYAEEIRRMGGKLFVIPTKSSSVAAFKEGLTRVIQENGYKHVLRVASNGMSFMDIAVAKKAGAEVLAVRSSNSSDEGGWKAALLHRVGKLLYGRHINVKIAPSDLAARYTFGDKAYARGDVTILHNAIDLSVFRYAPEARAEIRREFDLGEDTVLFGHVGRFDPQKNHTFLLEVFAEIAKTCPSARLMLVGRGGLEVQVRDKAAALGVAEQVIFTGVRADIPKLLSAMDGFVFPSFYEGMPNTVIEAQATGLPCVIADTITKEANVTGLVTYLPLSATAEEWAAVAQKAVAAPRRDTHDDMVKNRYDIESIVNEFTDVIFGK